MEYSELLVEKVGRVGVLTLNRPPKNSFSKKLLKEMLSAMEAFEQDDEIRTVFLKSTGEHFSRGADADDIKKAMDYNAYGGAPLLGVDGVVIKGHGSSKANTMHANISQAIKMVQAGVVDIIKENIPQMTVNE